MRQVLIAVILLAVVMEGTSKGQLSARPVPSQLPQVCGTISEVAGPVANARVTLFVPDLSFFREARSQGDGSYLIQRVPPGTYQLGVAARDRQYQERSISVSSSKKVENFQLSPEVHAGQWAIIGTTLPEFLDATDIAILTPGGKIFYCHDTVDPILFDPVTGTKVVPAASTAEQGCMSGTVLQDDRILMVGGQDGADPGSFRDAIPWVKAYDLDSNSWQWLDELQLAAGRWYPGLARLADGSLLAMGGGMAPDATRTDTCEIFDPGTLTWSFTGSMVNPCEFPPSALLFTGEVLATWSPPQLYNPQSGTWRLTGNFNQPNRSWPGHSDHSLVVLADGRALAIGIRDAGSGNQTMGEIFDPVSETWSLTSNPALLRQQAEVTPLPDGRILVAAGETEVANPPVPDLLGMVRWCDLYDSELDTWRRVADMSWFREYHAVTLLVPDGRVVTTGGTRIKFQVGPSTADIEAFSPPYLFRGVRPSITSISATSASRGDSLQLQIAPRTLLTSVVLIGTEAHTHWVDGGIPRRLVLPVQQSGGSVSVVLPTDANLLPLGHYMLFAMVDDIPSRARILKVE